MIVKEKLDRFLNSLHFVETNQFRDDTKKRRCIWAANGGIGMPPKVSLE
jgi:hypothetical protein